jgi:DNA-binding CsgD family transcriptional regulator
MRFSDATDFDFAPLEASTAATPRPQADPAAEAAMVLTAAQGEADGIRAAAHAEGLAAGRDEALAALAPAAGALDEAAEQVRRVAEAAADELEVQAVELALMLAEKIVGAAVVELPGRDHAIFSGDIDALADRIETFVTGSAPLPDPDRTLATILVARLVAPERSAALFGDRDWSERVERLHADIRDALGRSGGEPVDFNAERIIARFDGPAHAIRFALGMRDTTEAPELRPAFGIHVGEVSVGRSSISGLALHVAQQIAAEAKSGEIVISAVVRELMSGVGYRFAERGSTPMPANGGALRLLSVSAEQHLEPVTRLAGAPSLDMLTDREREILTLVANGLSNPAIAKRLDLSDHTVKRHVANILLKLDLPTRAAAAALVGRQRAL